MRKVIVNKLILSDIEHDGKERYFKCTNMHVFINGKKCDMYMKGQTGSIKIGPLDKYKSSRIFVMYKDNVLTIFKSPREYNDEKRKRGIGGYSIIERNYKAYTDSFIDSIEFKEISLDAMNDSKKEDTVNIPKENFSVSVKCFLEKGFKSRKCNQNKCGTVQLQFGFKGDTLSINGILDKNDVFIENTNSIWYKEFLEYRKDYLSKNKLPEEKTIDNTLLSRYSKYNIEELSRVIEELASVIILKCNNS